MSGIFDPLIFDSAIFDEEELPVVETVQAGTANGAGAGSTTFVRHPETRTPKWLTMLYDLDSDLYAATLGRAS